jgi:hypothetical protein
MSVRCDREGRTFLTTSSIEPGMVIHAALEFELCSTWLVMNKVEDPKAILMKEGWSIMEIDSTTYTVPGSTTQGKGEFSGRTSVLRRSGLSSWHTKTTRHESE